MRIAYLVNTYPRASHTFIRREVQALERRGFTVHRFAMRSERASLIDPADLAEDDRTEHVLAQGGMTLLRGALGWMLRHPAQSARAIAAAMRCGKLGQGGSPGTGGRLRHLVYLLEAAFVAQRCADLQVQHLHAHFGTNSAAVAMLAHLLGGPRYSFTVHGPEEFDAPLPLALGEKIRHAAFVVAISSFGRSQLYRWAALRDWSKLHVVHCGIEPAKFTAPAPPPSGGPHLVAIGRLAEQKGFSLLVDAVSLAAATHPDLRLTLVGDGPLRKELEAAIAANGLSQMITLAGWQDEAGVQRALAQAQALILPSFAEGLPMVVMEAMAAGRPVIATAIAGVPELVVSGETGWIVPAGDAVVLAEAIAALARTPQARLITMGAAARDRVLERHDIDVEAAKLSGLISPERGET
ncbi:colanic acid biosynthesis glycosyltransferase WcaL [Pseudorhodobacter sp. E13]|uniref:glycosyltransferase n=1 Tax=Pseudorhodobacter sp. E13 TaxID=2487931 RepID=UPI000F8CC340|nr:glycosyltransferase [Pseudorhodobacter sp. E13]RUS60137.1 colanic acid biosynthesis glycosyltransferase WcaL [Pseudorhodobacter sp. E13]